MYFGQEGNSWSPQREDSNSLQQEEAETPSAAPAVPRKSLLTEIIRKGDLKPKPSAVSPFASASQQSSPTTSTLDVSPAPSSKSSLGDELVRLGNTPAHLKVLLIEKHVWGDLLDSGARTLPL